MKRMYWMTLTRNIALGTIACVCVMLAGCCNQPPSGDGLLQLTSRLRNSDVKWYGTSFGLMARVKGKDAQQVLDKVDSSREAVIKALLNCLERKDQYVIAHVLLTKMGKGKHSSDHRYWNGLCVSLYADGTVTYGKNAQEKIMRMWKDKYPKSLPR